MATKLPRRDVLRVAELAHLTLTEAEVETFSRQLSDILDWMAAIQQTDTANVTPTFGVASGTPRWRADEPVASLPPEEALREAPDADPTTGLFRVPTVR